MTTLNPQLISVIIKDEPTQEAIASNIKNILARVSASGPIRVKTVSSDGFLSEWDSKGNLISKKTVVPPKVEKKESIPTVVVDAETGEKILGEPVTTAVLMEKASKVAELAGVPENGVLQVVTEDNQTMYFSADGEVTFPPQNPQYPPMGQQLKNLAGSIGRTIKGAITGKRVTVPSEVKESRLEECRKCEKWNAAGARGTGRCTVCGCSTNAKLSLAAEQCPHPEGPRWLAWVSEDAAE